MTMLSLMEWSFALAIVVVVITSVAYWTIKKVPRWRFESSVVLLTGGSAGIGLATAHELVSKKVLKLIIAARREDVLVCAVTQLREHALRANSPTEVEYVVMDVCNSDSVINGVNAANELVKPYHINLLICNAGFAHPARFLESTLTHASAMMEVNYFGMLRVL